LSLIAVLAAAWRQAGSTARAEDRGAEGRRCARAAEPLKVGFVYVSPVGDAAGPRSTTWDARDAPRRSATKVTSTFVEKVPEGADAERVIRDLAQQGHKLIFTTSSAS